MQSFKDFPKIDAHIHFNADRSNIADLAKEYSFDLLTINTEVPDFPSIQKQQSLARTHQQRNDAIELYYAATIDTSNIFDDGWAEQAIKKIKKNMNEGACGVKFWKNIGMDIQRADGSFVMLDDPELESIFYFLEEQQIPVLGHQGEPKNCWLPVDEMTIQSDRDYFSEHPQYHMYQHNEYPGYWEHVEARDAVLERHQQLQFTGLHLASLEWSLDEVAKRLDTYPNLTVDLAERISHLYYHAARDRDQVVNFFKEYQDRIIYGTDIINDPAKNSTKVVEDLTHRWQTHWQFFSTDKKFNSSQIDYSFRGLNLSRDILEKIYRKNAVREYKI